MGKKFYIVNEDDGCETYFPASGALLVPHETLSKEIQEDLDDDSGEPVFKHERFPAVSMTEVLRLLKENNLLKDLVERCREGQAMLEKENG